MNISALSPWLTVVAIVWLLGTIGLGWLVKSFVIILGLILVAPVVAVFWFRWWVKRNSIESSCPVCSYEFTGFQQSEFSCPSCGEALKAEKGHFQRLTPPGTIDVNAVEVL